MICTYFIMNEPTTLRLKDMRHKPGIKFIFKVVRHPIGGEPYWFDLGGKLRYKYRSESGLEWHKLNRPEQVKDCESWEVELV